MPNLPNNNLVLYIQIKELLQEVYIDQSIKGTFIKVLAMMITGRLLGPHVKRFAIAMCVPIRVVAQ